MNSSQKKNDNLDKRTGPLITAYLILSLIAFALVDLGVWLAAKGETMSQWVIRRHKESLAFKIGAWAFILLIIGVMVWLVWHWELV